MGRKIAIDVAGSSCVARAEYERDRGVLRIRYTGGLIYDYQHVPLETVEALRASISKGQFVNAEIKPRFAYRRRA